jgi:hypothetical protein
VALDGGLAGTVFWGRGRYPAPAAHFAVNRFL